MNPIKRYHSNTDNGESFEAEDSHVSIVHDTSDVTASSEPQTVDINEQKPSDGQLIGESNNDNHPILPMCRLRHGLNEDCLCEVFKFLDACDLMRLCDLDIYYQNLIVKWVIGKKLIDFTKMNPYWTTERIFEIFGKSMRKIKIAEENTLGRFEQFLSFVNQYCAVGGLTEIELRFKRPNAPQAIMDQSMPNFTNLRKLVLNAEWYVDYKEFLAGIAATASNLTHLTLIGVHVRGEWLTNGGMQHLKELRLYGSNIQDIIDSKLAGLLNTASELEFFSYIGDNYNYGLFDQLIDQLARFPKLKTRCGAVLNNFYQTYTLCGSDIYYALIGMEEDWMKMLEIDIYVGCQDREMRCSFQNQDSDQFTRLRRIEPILGNNYDKCEWDAEFICELASKLINVQVFTLNSNIRMQIKDAHKVFDMVPNLKQLDISQALLAHLPAAMLKIIRSIRKRRETLIATGIAEPEPFHLVANMDQWIEIQVYDDINRILKTTIRNRLFYGRDYSN